MIKNWYYTDNNIFFSFIYMAKSLSEDFLKIISSILSVLNSRQQEILKKRYGLGPSKPQTLEAIGKTYSITRERVRQIVEASLKIIKNSDKIKLLQPFTTKARLVLLDLGGLEEDKEFIQKLTDEFQLKPEHQYAIRFILTLDDNFIYEEENDLFYNYWHLNSLSTQEIQNNANKIINIFEKYKTLFTIDELVKKLQEDTKLSLPAKTVLIYLKLIKIIGINPFGEYGLRKWNSIEPSGAKDRAYMLMSHAKKPLHFTEIAKNLNMSLVPVGKEKKEIITSPLVLSKSWLKKVEVQTIHNELIKDSRFILIGRGIYALKEWGYKPGKIADVIKDVLKEAKKPLTQDEIIKEVQKRRITKTNTIILNLHNKKLFKKLPDKRYTLVSENKILEV